MPYKYKLIIWNQGIGGHIHKVNTFIHTTLYCVYNILDEL